jgi:hypothetical protein
MRVGTRLGEGQRTHRVYALCLLAATAVLLSACPQRLGADEHIAGAVISEFMAVNSSTLVDGDGEHSDWIEIQNTTSTPLDLGGWYLTDDRRNPVKWQFPPLVLPAQGYLVVFASGKDRAVAIDGLHTNFELPNGGEYLALVKPDGRTIAWEYAPYYPQQFADVSYGLVADQQARHLTQPTPGAANGSAVENRGPVLTVVSHAPLQPAPGQAIAVSAAVWEAYAPIDAVTAHLGVMFEAVAAVPMFDDGAHADGAAGDGVYGAFVPRGMVRAGEMVRYRITATDRQGHVSRWPLFHDPAGSPEYSGTMVADPSVRSDLPVLYWFVADPAAAASDEGTRAAVYYDGVFYDNVYVRLRGLTGRFWPKKSFKFDFNQGHHFQFLPDQAPVEEFNLNSTVTDKSYIRQILSWETYASAGVPASISFPMRVQQNGAFHSVSVFLEQPDERFLERQGLDDDGPLYKMKLFNILESSTEAVEKRTRLDEDHSDLQALIDGLRQDAGERTAYLFDHVDIPEMINYLAVAAILHDRDHGDNNYYMYRDTEDKEEWMVLPWDKDMTFGRTYLYGQGGTFNDVIWADRDPESHPLACYYVGNLLFDALLDTPAIQEMYLRRLRTVMDLFLQSPDTPAADLQFERRIDQLVAQMAPDVALDAERWEMSWGEAQTFAQATDIIKADYLPARRRHLYETHGPGGGGIIPPAQAGRTHVRFGEVEFDPISGDQDEEYFALVNGGDSAVDISGWSVVYDVEITFRPGVVIPAGGTLYISPDVAAFRERDRSPTGGEGHFVQGNYRGRLSNTWGVLKLYDAGSRLTALKVFWRDR